MARVDRNVQERMWDILMYILTFHMFNKEGIPW